MKGNLSSNGSCIIRLQSIQSVLLSAERRIADFVLDNPELVLNLTIEELAAKTLSSYATVNRLCKRLGYTGYKDFKSSLINDVIYNRGVDKLIYSQAITKDASTKVIAEKIYTLALNILEDGYKIMDSTIVDQAVDLMIGASMICCIGAGTSGISARYAGSKFFRIGLPTYNDNDSTHYRMQIALMTEKDVLFAISSSGRTSVIIDAVRFAKKNGVKVISLSDYAVSPLTKISDLNLFTTPRNSNMFMTIDMPLIIGQITIIDILYSCCCVRLAEKAAEKYEKTKVSADSEKMK